MWLTPIKRAAAVLSVVLLFLFPQSSFGIDDGPVLNHGKKWRIGYYEGGPYSDYTDTMRTFVDGLIQLGWIQEKNPPKLHGDMAKPYWEWLVRCNSPYLSFEPEDAYSAAWDEGKRTANRRLMMKKLKSGVLDLVIAMGAWAGIDLANNDHTVPTMVMSTSDPLEIAVNLETARQIGLHIPGSIVKITAELYEK